jgi:fumarate hydratase subunit beta
MVEKGRNINTPLTLDVVQQLKVGDLISISGSIFTGRDAALPRLVKLIKKEDTPFKLEGAVIMHTAVSQAGISPTTSNKVEIEESIAPLSRAGVRIHLGKGALSPETIDDLNQYKSVFAVTPPAAALLTSKVISSEVVAFPEEGMEAIHKLEVRGVPGIVAVAQGESLY